MAAWTKLRVLEKGSSAVVYLGDFVPSLKAIDNHVTIAIKTSRPYLAYALEKEGRILKYFRGCKEIVQCMGSHMTEENGDLTCNLLMEYAPYGSLGDLIKLKPLLEEQVRVFTRMILKGLSHIHHKGMVHYDLKPDNILLFPPSQHGERYQLKFSDFGLTKAKDDKFEAYKSCKSKFRGTPTYMSPESIMGKIDTALDIWSLGCIVIEMMTWLKAWKNSPIPAQDLMYKLAVLKENPKIPDGLSMDCKDFLGKCFLKDSTERWTANMLLNHPFSRISNQ